LLGLLWQKTKKRKRLQSLKNRRGLKPIKKAIRQLQHEVNSKEATLTHRLRAVNDLQHGVNAQAFASYVGSSTTLIEDNVLPNLQYYDPSTPGTLLTANGLTGAYFRDFDVHSQSGKITVRNNYLIPSKVSVYDCVPKVDTSISPTTAYTNGLTDQGGPTSTSPLVYLTDSKQFNELWKINNSKKALLAPGGELTMSHSNNKPFEYDPSLVDSHTFTYMPQYGSWSWVVRSEGVIGHDGADDKTTTQGGVDILYDTKHVIKYDAGIPLNLLAITNNAATAFSGTGYISQNVCDNQAYAVGN